MLEVQDLAARRGGRVVFRGISFVLKPGAALRVQGPNGSGKSSLLRSLAGLLEPFRGMVLWEGQNITGNLSGHRRRVSYISHHDALKPELTADETLAYWRAILGIGAKAEKIKDKEIFETFGLAALRNRPVRFFSAGQKRRLALARLLVAPARLWLLDEPTTALDREGQELFSALLTDHQRQGGNVIAVSHQETDLPAAATLDMENR